MYNYDHELHRQRLLLYSSPSRPLPDPALFKSRVVLPVLPGEFVHNPFPGKQPLSHVREQPLGNNDAGNESRVRSA